MKSFKQHFTEAKSDRTILAKIKLGKNDETNFWNAIGCVLEQSMSAAEEKHIVDDLMRRSQIFVTPILLKAIKKAIKTQGTCIDKTELAAVKKVFDATKTPLQRTKDAMKAGKMPKRAGKNITEAYKHSNPAMTNIRVEPETIDEWYGLVVRFNWKKKDFWTKWNETSDGNEAKLVELLVKEAQKSKEWKQFYKKFSNLTADSSSIDASPRDVTVPKFGPRDFDDWGFDQSGGWMSALERD
jgi:hypothetical protein